MSENNVKVTTGSIQTLIGVFDDAQEAVTKLDAYATNLRQECEALRTARAQCLEGLRTQEIERARAEGKAEAYQNALETIAGRPAAPIGPMLSEDAVKDMLLGGLPDDEEVPAWDTPSAEDMQTFLGHEIVDDVSEVFEAKEESKAAVPHDSTKVEALAADILQGVVSGNLNGDKVRGGFAELVKDALEKQGAPENTQQ